jgi:hypothetical protein
VATCSGEAKAMTSEGAASCFLRGTRILTPGGEWAVEDLCQGSVVVGLGGARGRVAWVARRRIDLRCHADPRAAWPVRIRRGAIANGVPARDLLVAPGTGLVIANRLMPASLLVNGATILRDSAWLRLEYTAIGLDQHDAVLAEQMPVESFPAGADRTVFGGVGVTLLHPSFAAASASPTDCAQRTVGGPAMEQARRGLLVRARVLGHALTREPDLHLLADGVRMDASGTSGMTYRFPIPLGTADIRIVSRAGVPAESDPSSEDRRRLGVLLASVVLRTGREAIELPPDDPALSEGFHPPETYSGARARWTDGHARLPYVPAGLRRMDLTVLAAQPAWARAAPPDAPMNRSA